MKTILLSAFFLFTGFYVMYESDMFAENAQTNENISYYNFPTVDTIPPKSADPLQQLFDAVDKMERKLEGMGKQPDKEGVSDDSSTVKKFIDEVHRTVVHIEEEITKSLSPKKDTLSQHLQEEKGNEVDSLILRDSL